MSTPLDFPARSTRMSLPFLFVGQAQKEPTVNEAFARIDALITPAIEGEASAPPASAAEGESWLVGADAQGEWAGHEGEIAFLSAGIWMFATPQPGQPVFDKASGCVRRWHGGWQQLVLPGAPAGGSVVDIEARAALNALVDGLRSAGYGV